MSRAAVLALVLAVSLAGCAVGERLVADNGDLADYRAFRTAGPEGARLARAQDYLEAHPRGRWQPEVRAAFDAEEPAFFEKCQAARDAIRDYLVDLPRGPHADAALSLLVAYDTKVEDIETARLMRAARSTEAKLEAAAARRRAVGEAILAAVGALLEDGLYGEHLEDTPPAIRRVLGGEAPTTWGTTPARRERDLFFWIPTHDGRDGRVATLAVRVVIERGVVTEGRIEGPDLFVRWDEADLVRSLDASSPNHRSEAALHAREILDGAFEARLPAARCQEVRADGELVRRACDGWSARVQWAQEEGRPDVVVIRGPVHAEIR